MIDSSVDYKNLPRPTWAEIDIDAILNNINEYKKALGNKVEIIVAAKGNGYGHGMLPIVKAINELDIYGFATGNMYEAIEMRKNGIDKPIQLFAHNFPETADLLVKYDLMPSFVKPGDAKSFADALGKDVALKVWVKCDTGLGRLGLLPEEVLPELEYIRNETSFKIEGLYSHIGPTDSDKNPKKDEYNEGQISCFNKILAKLSPEDQKTIVDICRQECANSVNYAKEEDEKYLKLMEDNGIKIVRFTDEEIEMFAEAVRTDVWPQLAKTYGEDFINELLKLYK